MRFVTTTRFAKARAKCLKKVLREYGRGLPYSACLELTARLFGYSNYHELHKTEGYKPVSPFDEHIGKTTLEKRFSYQEYVLAEAGFADIAGSVLDKVNPTGCRRTNAVAAELPRPEIDVSHSQTGNSI